MSRDSNNCTKARHMFAHRPIEPGPGPGRRSRRSLGARVAWWKAASEGAPSTGMVNGPVRCTGTFVSAMLHAYYSLIKSYCRRTSFPSTVVTCTVSGRIVSGRGPTSMGDPGPRTSCRFN
ncbi:Piso0_005854 [Millerozyma farinosa CBS 7064]|uniref:Piso0_005854 protein n=1 Tax=Pichia sorbitophila (strain ATCC MYA-4447 / BCRC 22081 / CBS 7064 / NBRC 10061 / NRRL Y-12695) TaxID=559304 RepID=G8Y047_PICSO|nr:Piso0_005854 [Millerozyma farinosa CBS 7064]